jgi:hypothetical protein
MVFIEATKGLHPLTMVLWLYIAVRDVTNSSW